VFAGARLGMIITTSRCAGVDLTYGASLLLWGLIRFRGTQGALDRQRVQYDAIISPFGHVYYCTNSGIIRCPHAQHPLAKVSAIFVSASQTYLLRGTIAAVM